MVDIEQAQQLADAATAAPWRWTQRGIDGGERYWTDVLVGGRVDCMAHCYGGSSTLKMDNEAADSALIVFMRNNWAGLLALVVQLQARIKAADEDKADLGDLITSLTRESDEFEADRDRLRADNTELRTQLAELRMLAEAGKVVTPNAPYTGVSWQRMFEVLDGSGGCPFLGCDQPNGHGHIWPPVAEAALRAVVGGDETG